MIEVTTANELKLSIDVELNQMFILILLWVNVICGIIFVEPLNNYNLYCWSIKMHWLLATESLILAMVSHCDQFKLLICSFPSTLSHIKIVSKAFLINYLIVYLISINTVYRVWIDISDIIHIYHFWFRNSANFWKAM